MHEHEDLHIHEIEAEHRLTAVEKLAGSNQIRLAGRR